MAGIMGIWWAATICNDPNSCGSIIAKRKSSNRFIKYTRDGLVTLSTSQMEEKKTMHKTPGATTYVETDIKIMATVGRDWLRTGMPKTGSPVTCTGHKEVTGFKVRHFSLGQLFVMAALISSPSPSWNN